MRLTKILLFITILVFQYQCTASTKDFDPYKILGLSRSADEKEIRQAYKKLAKHWHPDKNSDPDANERFTKINAAYEILSDSTKRQEYDEYGTTSQDRQYNYNSNHYRDPFDTFRAHFGEDFQNFFGSFNGGGNARKIINSRELLSNILPNSDKKPYILFGWTTFCYSCRHSLSIFRGMEQQLNEVGIGTGEFNVNDQRISDELGVASAPALCIISQGRVYHFNGDAKGKSYSESSIKEFLRQSIPIGRNVQTLHNSNEILSFINSYNESNRIQALLVTKQKIPSLKFVLPCLQYLSRIQCAVLNSSVISQEQMLPFLRQISTYTDSVLLFKENQNPKAVLRENDVSYENIKQLFEDNQLLDLSVLTSKIILDKACEKNSNKRCFIMIGDRQLLEQSRPVLLKIAQSLLREQGTKMIYIDVSINQQSGFSQIFSSIFRGNEKKLFILVVRRWLEDSLEYVNTEIEFDESSLEKFQKNQIQMLADIETNLKLHVAARWQNAKKFRLPTIIDLDKRQKSAFYFIVDSIENKWNYWIERNPILRTLASYFWTYQFWLCFLPILVYFIFSRQDSEDSTKLNAKNRKKHTETAQATNDDRRERQSATDIAEFNLPLLQNYTRPGAANVIILVLIADGTNDPCIGYFNRQIASIKDSRMVFAILYRHRSSRWLNELYANIEADQNKPNFRCTSSTVLALYIRRKFFIPYWSLTNRQELSDESAAFLGMDQHQHRSSLTSSDDSINSSCDSLTFSDWIDLLFDGNFRNPISVTDWPTSFS